MRSRVARLAVVAAFSLSVVLGATQLFAAKPGGGGTGTCPRGQFCLCAQIHCPVTCANNCHLVDIARGDWLDTAALARVLGKPSVSLVAESEMKALFPDCETGAMPPFGQLYGLPVWVDACFPKAGEFAFQAGNHHEVVRMRYAEYERLARPVVAEFCRH